MNTIQKEKGKRALHVFLSYAAADREYARKLFNLLSQRSNLHIFTLEGLSAGEAWESMLKEALSLCDIFIVLLSPNSVYSKWVLPELGAAWALNKLIIAVTTETELLSKIPMDLRKIYSVETAYLENHPEVIDQILERYEGRSSFTLLSS